MTVFYEHLRVDISPEALEHLEAALLIAHSHAEGVHARQELLNLANECRARLQRVGVGEPDISERPVDEAWLDV